MSNVVIEKLKLKSNGNFCILKEPFEKKQHSNQQGGLDLYVIVIDHDTGNRNTVKLYENKKGLHFKKQGSWYLSEFTRDFLYVPLQIIELY